MKSTEVILPVVMFMSVFLAACGPRESASEKSTQTESIPQAPVASAALNEVSGGAGLKARPKLVPVKSFSERSTKELVFYRSTAPASSDASAPSVVINNNTYPNAEPASTAVKSTPAAQGGKRAVY